MGINIIIESPLGAIIWSYNKYSKDIFHANYNCDCWGWHIFFHKLGAMPPGILFIINCLCSLFCRYGELGFPNDSKF